AVTAGWTPTPHPAITDVDVYGDGRFRIGGAVRDGSVVVQPARVDPWPVERIADVTAESLRSVLDTEPSVELLLIGCGAHAALLPAALRARLRELGIGIETMDTGAACRTYNVLA